MKQKFLQNWKSGLTVSLVSIPLGVALAIASGATPSQGIITGFWAGLIAALFGGSHFNIVGPSGSLPGIIVAAAILYGASVLPFVAILAGIFIFVAYLFRLDKYIIFIPKSVVHGFTLGIAIILAIGQIDNILGLTGIPKTENLIENLWVSLQHLGQLQWPSVGLFLFGFLFIYFWNRKFPKLPGAILLAFASISLVFVFQKFGIHVPVLTLGGKYPEIQTTLFINIFHDFDWKVLFEKKILLISLTTAVVGMLETLLSGQIANTMTKTKFDRGREVLGLSLANIGAGLMGGIPATAVFARTALNIKSGASDRTSGIVSAFFIGFISLVLLNYFELIPLSIIAAILVSVAMGMVEKRHFISILKSSKTSFILSLLVALIVVVEDPIAGIILGSVVALLIFVREMSYGQTEILLWKNKKFSESVLRNDLLVRKKIDSDVVVYKISGNLTYVNMPAHLKAMERIKGNDAVIISMRHAFYVDIDGIDYLEEMVEILKQNNKKVFLCGVNKEVEKQITHRDFYKTKLVEGKIYKRTSEALSEVFR